MTDHPFWILSCLVNLGREFIEYLSPLMLRFHPHYLSLDEDTVMWRYLEFWKFEDLLDSGELYFTRADHMLIQDHAEGMQTKSLQAFFKSALSTKFFSDLKKRGVSSFGRVPLSHRGVLSFRNEMRSRSLAHYKYVRDRTYMNCWHSNADENSLMWAAYVPSGRGIALRSRLGRIMKSLSDTKYDILIFPIDYVDHDKVPLDRNRISGGIPQMVQDMLSKKRKAFSGEAEMRLLTDNIAFEKKWVPNIIGTGIDASEESTIKFIRIPVSLEHIVEKIILPPKCDRVLDEEVRALVRRTESDLSNRIFQSTI